VSTAAKQGHKAEYQVSLSRDISIPLCAQEALIRITDALKFG
jgi:hypothetical protein